MSSGEGFLILDTQNAAKSGEKAGKAAKLGLQNMARRTLGDISNLQQKPKQLIRDEKRQSIQITTKEYVEKLQKDNMALMKMLVQRNKIIEQTGIELDRLRVNLIKAREQNQQLALSNSQMLAELNSGKDRLKALQHELGCKNAVLKARKLDEEKPSMRPCQNADPEVSLNKLLEEGEFQFSDNEKPRNTKRKVRSQSLGSSQPSQSEENAGNKKPPYKRRQSAMFKTDDAPKGTLSDEASQNQENAANKRPCVRRQSARFKAVEANDVKSPNCPSADEPEPVLEKESESQVSGRPSRAAAKKVQSYKEIPVNVKMRRSE